MKMGFGVIVTTRSFFSSKLAVAERINVLEKLRDEGYEAIIPPEDATFAGAVSSLVDADIYASYFKANRDKIDGIIVVAANFGDETSVAEAIRMSKLDVPVLIQACDDDMTLMDIPHRRDAFCGKISICNNLYQRNIRFTNTTVHTCSIGSEAFKQNIHRFAGICRVVKGLRDARIGAIGARPDAFQTVRFSEKLLQSSGISVVVSDLSEIIFAADNFNDKEAIDARISEIKAYGNIPSYISNEKIEKQAKLSLVLEEWMKANNCSASAIQCWNAIPNIYGCATCTSMSMMGEKGLPSACEMDVTGAVTMLSLKLAAQEPPGYLDWNNNYYEEPNMCINTHCSNFPKSFMGSDDFEIENLDVLATTIDVEKCFGACKGKVAAGDMTFAKITTDDKNGRIKAYIGEGRFEPHSIDTKGGIALCKIDNLQKLMDFICKNGFEHHVAMCRGHVADILEEAFTNYMGWEVYRHN